MSAEVLVVWRS